MQRRTADEFPQELLNLFDEYVHGIIDRRGFLDRAGKFAVGGTTAVMLLDALSPKFAEAQQVARDDKRLKTDYAEFDSPNGTGKVRGYLARPANAEGKKLPAILVIHENRGLNPHIEDIARRLALDNFMAFAPDALTPLGGYPGDEDKARELFPKLDQSKTREDFVNAARWLKNRPDATGRIGAVGFCYGGGIVNMLAARLGSDLAAGVPFNGNQLHAEQAANNNAPQQLKYAATDQRIKARIPDYDDALKAAGVPHQVYIYEGTQHGFNNDTTPRYDEKSAKLAWSRTVEFFNKHVRSAS